MFSVILNLLVIFPLPVQNDKSHYYSKNTAEKTAESAAVSEYLYFQIGRGFDLEEARARITEAVKGLDKKYPELIGEPFFGGIVSFPEIKPPGIPLEYCTASVGFRCLGQNRSRLAFALREELVTAVNDLMYGASDGAIHVRIDGKS